MKTLIAVLALSLTAAGAAVAGEGNGEPFAFQAPAQVMSLQNFKQGPGSSQNPFPFSSAATPMIANQVLPTAGAQGAVQTANSLPAGFETGMPGQTNPNAETAPTRLAQPTVTQPTNG
jgi:hypothetical protein